MVPPKEGRMSRRILITSTVAVVAFLSGGWFMQQGSRPSESVYQRARLFDDILSHVSELYVDSIDQKQLYRMAIDGMLAELRDPYTGYLDGRDLRNLNELSTGNYAGIGAQIEVRDGAIVVVAPMPETPAERAGVLAGDRIVEVSGKTTVGMTQDDAVRALRGPEGSQVTLRVVRAGATELITFTLTRARIHSRFVRTVMMLEGGVGYVETNAFSQSAADELQAAVDSLKRLGMRSLVLDLRNNPGGLLTEGLGVADLFLSPGQEIVATRGRAPRSTETFADEAPQRYPTLPVVVLVNGFSASSAEIVAGALQDHDRALLIGTATFGKGLVQTVYRIGGDAALKLTTARWYTPSGRSIQRPSRHGFEPDANPDDSVPPAVPDTAHRQTYRTDGGRTMRGGGGIDPDIVVRADSADTQAIERLTQILGRNVPKYQDALAAFAFQARQRFGIANPTFAFTAEMRAAFLEQLRQRGVDLDEQTLRIAGHFIDQQLADQAARLNFGREGQVRRAVRDDPVLAEAVRVASRARTPAELLAMAPARPAEATAGAPPAATPRP
jgi:carboxyl-terminal processing protease